MGGDTNRRIDEHFDRLAFANPIPAHGASSGILFTNPQPVTKLLNVDLLGNKRMIPFTLFLPVTLVTVNMPGTTSTRVTPSRCSATSSGCRSPSRSRS